MDYKKIFTEYKKWFITGLLLGISFLHPLLWWSAFFGIAYLIDSAKKTSNFKKLVAGTFLMGFTQFAIIVWWFWSVLPIDDFDIPNMLAFFAVLYSWSFSAFFLGIAKLLVTSWLYFLKEKWYVFWTLPFVWVLSDIIGAVLFAIQSYGAGSTLNANFSFGWLGYLFSEVSFLLPLASIGGVFILTVLYIFAGILLFTLLQSKYPYRVPVATSLICVLFLSAELPFFERTYDNSYTVAALETSIDSPRGLNRGELAVYQNTLMHYVDEAIRSGNDYIILPEGANMTGAFVSTEELLTYLKNTSLKDVVVVDSGWYQASESSSYSRARIYDTKTMKVYEMDKHYLVPQGEFPTYIFVQLLRLFELEDDTKKYLQSFDYVPGELTDSPDWPEYLPGVMFCFESVSPFGVRNAASIRNVPFVAHPVSHAWFHDPDIFWHQLDQMLKINARFGGVEVYLAANMSEAKRY